MTARFFHRRFLLVVALAAAPAAASAQVAFPVAFDQGAMLLSAEERLQLATHVREAGRRWTSLLVLDGPRSIEVQVVLSDAVPRATGHSVVSTFVGVEAGRDTYEQGVAHELRTGADQNGVQPDIRITLNPDYLRQELWFDPDPQQRSAPVPKQRTDALSVMLHEFGHALAYNGWAGGAGMAPGGFWSTFDRWMLAGDPVLFDGPAVLQQLGSRPELTRDNVHHWDNAGLPGKQARIPAPPPWAHGAPQPQPACAGMASVAAPPSDNWRKGDLSGGLRSELMNGVVFYRGTRYAISPLDRAALIDAGLPVDRAPIFAGGFE
jgi:hypothetical protein